MEFVESELRQKSVELMELKETAYQKKLSHAGRSGVGGLLLLTITTTATTTTTTITTTTITTITTTTTKRRLRNACVQNIVVRMLTNHGPEFIFSRT